MRHRNGTLILSTPLYLHTLIPSTSLSHPHPYTLHIPETVLRCVRIWHVFVIPVGPSPVLVSSATARVTVGVRLRVRVRLLGDVWGWV